MRALIRFSAALALAALGLVARTAGAAGCPPDSVAVGTACVDRYEASVWQIPVPSTVNVRIVKKLVAGKATEADLAAVGAVQLGATTPPFSMLAYPASFPPDGRWTPIAGSDPPTPGVYAASLPGVLPSTDLTWSQADQACALAGKRLITSYEWQVATAGTPDPGMADDGATSCVTQSAFPVPTGSRTACVSSFGVHDTIGNVDEFVADWGERGVCFSELEGDLMCFASSGSFPFPGARTRGGLTNVGLNANRNGSFYVGTEFMDSATFLHGFRCAR